MQLFIPLIPANTERRDEGYFRREWSLAVDRTRDMTEKKTFLVPVVIDETNQRKACVPEKFRHVRMPTVSRCSVATAYAYRGEMDLAFRFLEASYQQREPDLLGLKTDPLLTSLRSDQRYNALLRKMNLPESP